MPKPASDEPTNSGGFDSNDALVISEFDLQMWYISPSTPIWSVQLTSVIALPTYAAVMSVGSAIQGSNVFSNTVTQLDDSVDKFVRPFESWIVTQ